MKVFNIKSLMSAVALLLLVSGCGLLDVDNFDEPDATIEGRLVYNGEPIKVRNNGIELELWQPGFELNEKIQVFVDQNGSFSSKVFSNICMIRKAPTPPISPKNSQGNRALVN